jgi:hypothetical protein
MNRPSVAQLPLADVVASRRKCLRALAAWGGLVLAAGCSVAPPSPPSSAPPPPPARPSSGDALLDELRRLAVDAPLDELLAWRLMFLMELGSTYRNDPLLWRGVERMCQATLDGTPMPPARQSVGDGPDRRLFARLLAQVIERGEPGLSAPLQPRVVELRRIP